MCWLRQRIHSVHNLISWSLSVCGFLCFVQFADQAFCVSDAPQNIRFASWGFPATVAFIWTWQIPVCTTGSEHEDAKESVHVLCSAPLSSVGGVHCVDVAVQLVSERQPGLGGEVDLGAPAEASCSFAVAAPGRRGGQAGRHVLYGNWVGEDRVGPCHYLQPWSGFSYVK